MTQSPLTYSRLLLCRICLQKPHRIVQVPRDLGMNSRRLRYRHSLTSDQLSCRLAAVRAPRCCPNSRRKLDRPPWAAQCYEKAIWTVIRVRETTLAFPDSWNADEVGFIANNGTSVQNSADRMSVMHFGPCGSGCGGLDDMQSRVERALRSLSLSYMLYRDIMTMKGLQDDTCTYHMTTV